jgi:hypothetical protein
MAKEYEPINRNGAHKFYSNSDVKEGAVCDCALCVVPKKAAKKEEKKE